MEITAKEVKVIVMEDSNTPMDYKEVLTRTQKKDRLRATAGNN